MPEAADGPEAGEGAAMIIDRPQRRQGDSAAGRPEADGEVLPEAGPGEREEGGDPVCWAHLVCPECGGMASEGHRAGCRSGPAP